MGVSGGDRGGNARSKQQQQRGGGREDAAEEPRVRVKIFRFGEHISEGGSSSSGASGGTLALLPCSPDTPFETVQGAVLRAAFGEDINLQSISAYRVRILLFPDGDEIDKSGEAGGAEERRRPRIYCVWGSRWHESRARSCVHTGMY